MILYLLKMSLCSAVLLFFYRMFLEREKMLRFNRFYLLGSLAVSLVLPLVPLQVQAERAYLTALPIGALVSENTDALVFAIEPTASLTETALPWSISWPLVAGVLYLIVSGYLVLKFLKNLESLLNRVRLSQNVKQEGTKLVLLDAPTLPHSFLNFIFLNKKDYLTEKIEAEILAHERAHVRQRHTLDVLSVEFLRAVFWINPALYFYRQSIVLNHEFLADEAVLKANRNIPAYQQLLLRKSASSPKLVFASQFNFSFIKKRFVMMNKQTSRTKATLVKIALLPLLLLVFLAFSDLSLAQVSPPPPPVERAPPPPPVEMGSSDLVGEYNAILMPYIDKSKPTFTFEPSKEDGKRLEELLTSMTKEQKASLDYLVSKINPLPKVTPSQADLERYKESNVYGIWVDNKKVLNTELNKYKAGDFSQVYVSKLMPKAQKTIGYKYNYQVDLMTAAHYETYRKETLESPRQYMILKKDRFKQ